LKQRKVYCCSACHQPGHNIIRCRSPIFREMNNCFKRMIHNCQVSFPTYYLFKLYQCLLDERDNFDVTYEQFLMTRGISLRIINESMNMSINKPVLMIVKYYSTLNISSDYDFLKEFIKQQNIFKEEYERILAVQQIQELMRNTPRPIIQEEAILQSKPVINIEKIQNIEEEKYEVENENECCVCLNTFKKKIYVMFNCKHELCKECCKKIIQTVNTCKCPQCRVKINNITVIDNYTVNELKDCLK